MTGNATTPLIMVANPSSGAIGAYTQTSVTATPAAVSGLAVGPANTYTAGVAKLVNGMICLSAGSGTASPASPTSWSSYWQIAPNTADLTKATSYVQSATLSGKQMVDITFFNNTWIAVGFGGIFTAPNGGTPSVPAGPTAAWTTALPVTNNYGVYSIDTNGSIAVAVGSDTTSGYIGAIYTSTDGVTWTRNNRFQFDAVTLANGNCFTNVIWDGKQFVLTGGLNNNLIATSPDGLAWTGIYAPDYTEQPGATCASPLGIFSGTVTAGTWVGGSQSSPGGFTPWSTTNTIGVGFSASAVANGSRTVTGITVPGGTTSSTVANTTATQAVPTTPLTHYYEIIATAVSSTNNQFTFQFAIDGVLLPGTFGPYYFGSTSDTTGLARLLINLPRTGNWTVVDDIYVTTMNGANNVGQLGVVQVLPWQPASDAQAQFAQSSAHASDAATVAGPLSNAQSYVYANGVGTKDVYNASNAIQAGYRVRAVQAEAYFAKYGSIGATASVGIVSGAAELDSAAVNAVTATPVYASVIAEADPATGAAWTVAGAQAAKIAITKVT